MQGPAEAPSDLWLEAWWRAMILLPIRKGILLQAMPEARQAVRGCPAPQASRPVQRQARPRAVCRTGEATTESARS